MAFELGDLKARLLVDSKGFNDTLARAGESARTTFRDIGGAVAGAFTFGAIAARVKEAMELADRIEDAATAAGTTATRLQALERAAQAAGAGTEKIAFAMQRIDLARAAAGTGSDDGLKLAESMERLGVSSGMLAASDPAVIIEQIGRALNASGDSAQAMSDVYAIFGARVGPAFIQTLREIGSEGLDPMIARLEASGRIMSTSMVEDLADANKGLEAFGQQMTIFAGKIANVGINLREMFYLLALGQSWSQAYENATTTWVDPPSVAASQEAEKERQKIEQAINANYDRAAQISAKGDDARLTKAEQLRKITEEIASLNEQAYGADALKRSQLFTRYTELQAQAEPLRREIKAASDKRAEAQNRDFDKRLQSAASWGREMERRLSDIASGKGVSISAPQAADQLARVGGFVGGQNDPMISIAQRQLQIQTQTRELMAQIAAQLQTMTIQQLGGYQE